MRFSINQKRQIADLRFIRSIGSLCFVLAMGLVLITPSELMGQFSRKAFYTLRPDDRKCAYPLCGGYWVQMCNRRKSPCLGGSKGNECYVASLNWNLMNLTPEEIAIVEGLIADEDHTLILKGRQFERDWEGFGVLSELRVEQAYISASDDEPDGRFAILKDNGTVCVASVDDDDDAPCFHINYRELNRKGYLVVISEVDLDGVDASEEDLQEALKLLKNGSLIAVGENEEDNSGSVGGGITFDAENFFLPLVLEDFDPPEEEEAVAAAE